MPLITIEQARSEVLAAAQPLKSELVKIADALGRVLAQDLTATGDLPPFPSSAMDGYAIRGGEDGHASLEVVGESSAGHPWPGELERGQAVRISTGAAVASGADLVVRQEDVEDDGSGQIRIVVMPPAGENIRPAGEVMQRGQVVLPRATRLDPTALAAAVSAGANEVLVTRRPRAQILTTGDELREPGEPLGPGEIYNSNGLMLAGLVARTGAQALSPGRLPDDLAATEQGLAAALQDGEVVIVVGGVSVGPHDHVKPALAALGVEQRFWGVALQPGKPTWFGTREDKLVFGLPGNPVSAAVTFALFVWPAICRLQGAPMPRAANATAQLGERARRNRDREQALRVRLENRDGRLLAIPNGSQGSHVITSLVGADALALVPPGEGFLEPGAAVALEPLPV